MVSLYLFKDKPHIYLSIALLSCLGTYCPFFSPHLIFFKFLLFLYLLNFFGGGQLFSSDPVSNIYNFSKATVRSEKYALFSHTRCN